MIVVPEDQASSKLAAELHDAKSLPQVPIDDPPPGYTPQEVQIATASTTNQPISVPDIKPSNFIHLSRPNSSVKGTWLIEPTLNIPSAFLPPLPSGETDETRKNIFLESRNGSVDADIFVVPTSTEALARIKHHKRVYIHTTSRNGSVTTKIHEVTPLNTVESRLPLVITSHSANGRVSVYLPRSFHGPIRVKTMNGSVRFSNSVQTLLTSFSDIDRTQRSFLGHFDPSEWEEGAEWTGDELSVDAFNGSVKVYFDDEVNSSGNSKTQGFFGRLFQF
ncbi:hypothetical protein BDZ97DRAFT_1846538 [Flammula alnicola]|nr:hypothetical protein BDZ97DRAFT_1846538 [Flammula alnicola]